MAIVTTDSQNYADIAEAIRNKGVNGSFKPNQMAQAIEDIESGGGVDSSYYWDTAPRFQDNLSDENPVFNCPYCISFESMFAAGSGKIPPQKTITISSNANVTSMSSAFNAYNGTNTPLTAIVLNMDLSHCTSFDRMIGSHPNLTTIGGTPIDFSGVSESRTTSNNRFCQASTNNTTPISVEFVPHTLKGSIYFGNALFSDESMVSIANCLTATTKTIALSDTMKTKCQTIMGTVSQVTDDDITYDFFTAGTSGTVTLENFITQTKGWTIA